MHKRSAPVERIGFELCLIIANFIPMGDLHHISFNGALNRLFIILRGGNEISSFLHNRGSFFVHAHDTSNLLFNRLDLDFDVLDDFLLGFFPRGSEISQVFL